MAARRDIEYLTQEQAERPWGQAAELQAEASTVAHLFQREVAQLAALALERGSWTP